MSVLLIAKSFWQKAKSQLRYIYIHIHIYRTYIIYKYKYIYLSWDLVSARVIQQCSAYSLDWETRTGTDTKTVRLQWNTHAHMLDSCLSISWGVRHHTENTTLEETVSTGDDFNCQSVSYQKIHLQSECSVSPTTYLHCTQFATWEHYTFHLFYSLLHILHSALNHTV